MFKSVVCIVLIALIASLVSAQQVSYSSTDVQNLLNAKKQQLQQVQSALVEIAILSDASSSVGNTSPLYTEYINEKASTKKSLLDLIVKLQYEVDNIQKMTIKSATTVTTSSTSSSANTVITSAPSNLTPEQLAQKSEAALKQQQTESKVYKLAGDLILTKVMTKLQAKRFAIEITGGVQRSEFKLLYRATRDGFGIDTFHNKVDNKNATVTIIKSDTGAVFGGYTSKSWDKSGNLYHDPSLFLFAIIGAKGEERFVVSAPIGAPTIHCLSNNMVRFGIKGDDLALRGERGFVDMDSFKKPSDYEKSGSIAGVPHEFKVAEIEVYSL